VTGTVAGKGYAYWLEHLVQTAYAASSSTPPSCSVVSVGGQRVAWLFSPGTSGAITCSEPEDRGLYLGGRRGTARL